MTACIVGWAHTPFGKLANESDLSVRCERAAQFIALKLWERAELPCSRCCVGRASWRGYSER